MQPLSDFLVGVVVGIRYRANFSLEDQLGAILDKIIYTPGSYFGPHLFPKVLNRVSEKILLNEEAQHRLTINNSNIVLDITFGDSLPATEYQKVIKKFQELIIDDIFVHHKIAEFNRIGLINRYLFPMESLAKTFIDKTIGSTLQGINDINLNFSKKIPIQEALIKKDINDYFNVIFNVIKRADRDELFMAVDFQRYFDPFLPSSTQLEFSDFVRRVTDFNEKNFLNWLRSNYGELQ